MINVQQFQNVAPPNPPRSYGNCAPPPILLSAGFQIRIWILRWHLEFVIRKIYLKKKYYLLKNVSHPMPHLCKEFSIILTIRVFNGQCYLNEEVPAHCVRRQVALCLHFDRHVPEHLRNDPEPRRLGLVWGNLQWNKQCMWMLWNILEKSVIGSNIHIEVNELFTHFGSCFLKRSRRFGFSTRSSILLAVMFFFNVYTMISICECMICMDQLCLK